MRTEAAAIRDYAVGAVKSCVSRVRVKLTALLGLDGVDAATTVVASDGASDSPP